MESNIVTAGMYGSYGGERKLQWNKKLQQHFFVQFFRDRSMNTFREFFYNITKQKHKRSTQNQPCTFLRHKP
jgi:hypothetical protein